MSGFQGNRRVGYSKCNHLNEAGEQRHDWKSRKLCQRLQAEAQRKVQAGKKRQKKVFVSGELGHAYWHKIVPVGRNSNNSLFFEGDVIFSWGTHYPLVRRITLKNGKVVALYNANKSSISTSGHRGIVRSAMPGNIVSFDVKYPSRVDRSYTSSRGYYGGGAFFDEAPDADTHASNVKQYIDEITALVAKSKRATSVHGKQWNLNSARASYNEAAKYIKVFGLKGFKLPDVPKLNGAVIRKMKAHAEELAKTLAEHTVQKLQGEMERWRNGGQVYFSWKQRRMLPTMLRIEGNEVVTSERARVPVAGKLGAANLFRFLKSLKDAGRTFQRNGKSRFVGSFSIDSFDGDVLVAGCHRLAWQEIERISQAVLDREAQLAVLPAAEEASVA